MPHQNKQHLSKTQLDAKRLVENSQFIVTSSMDVSKMRLQETIKYFQTIINYFSLELT